MPKNLKALLVGPNQERRAEIVSALLREKVTVLSELTTYSGVRGLKQEAAEWDLALLDLDSDPELCLAVVQALSSRHPAATVMVYSRRNEPEWLIRCMRAGAREYLVLPLDLKTLHEALARAATRRLEGMGVDSAGGVLLFLGSKGGAGVSTIAVNFALALQLEGVSTALVDLDLELGESALLLGLNPQFTLADVADNARRLDGELLAGMMTRHDSGLSVLPGPDLVNDSLRFENGDVSRLMNLLQEKFRFVVVDAGHGLYKNVRLLVEVAETIYLVTQPEIMALRNAQRYIRHLQKLGVPKLRLVLNRFDPKRLEIDEEHIAKAVGVPVDWRLPSDYHFLRRAQVSGTPFALGDSPIAKLIRQMARDACGKPMETSSRRTFRLFG